MNSNTRIIVNTLSQHVRSVVNIVLSLYSTRLVLQALGQSDFGIFSLVGGVVAMLGFVTNAMVVATQRHLSFQHGRKDINEVSKIFSNSLFLHILIGAILSIVILSLEPILFNGFLKIAPSRIYESAIVYRLMTLALLFTFTAAPYKALFLARENIVYISIIEVSDGILKLLCAIWLLECQHDRLIAYAYIMMGIMAFNYLAFAIYAKFHFFESVLFPKYRHLNKRSIFDILNIASWTMYMMGCILGRTQGMAIIFNRFFGTIINASYGIAMQISGAVHFVAQAVTNAMSPQIYKAEGMGNRARMLSMSEAASKYSYLLMSIATIPVVFEMDSILHIWLGNIPEYATMLCQFILITSLIDQSTTGLTIANMAVGRIRNYAIVTNTIKLLTLPLVYVVLFFEPYAELAMSCYLVMELLSALIRLPFLKATAGLSITQYTKDVFLRIITPTITLAAISWASTTFINVPFRFLLTIITSVGVSIPIIWYTSLLKNEREYIAQTIGSRIKKHKQ